MVYLPYVCTLERCFFLGYLRPGIIISTDTCEWCRNYKKHDSTRCGGEVCSRDQAPPTCPPTPNSLLSVISTPCHTSSPPPTLDPDTPPPAISLPCHYLNCNENRLKLSLGRVSSCCHYRVYPPSRHVLFGDVPPRILISTDGCPKCGEYKKNNQSCCYGRICPPSRQ